MWAREVYFAVVFCVASSAFLSHRRQPYFAETRIHPPITNTSPESASELALGILGELCAGLCVSKLLSWARLPDRGAEGEG